MIGGSIHSLLERGQGVCHESIDNGRLTIDNFLSTHPVVRNLNLDFPYIPNSSQAGGGMNDVQHFDAFLADAVDD